MTRPYCDRLRKRFDDYYDGELSKFLFKVVDRHLKSCAECRDEYRLLEGTMKALRLLQPPTVPARALRKVRDTLSGPGGGAPYPGRLLGPDLGQGLQSP
jgi:anti-sigma factor RsiW